MSIIVVDIKNEERVFTLDGSKGISCSYDCDGKFSTKHSNENPKDNTFIEKCIHPCTQYFVPSRRICEIRTPENKLSYYGLSGKEQEKL